MDVIFTFDVARNWTIYLQGLKGWSRWNVLHSIVFVSKNEKLRIEWKNHYGFSSALLRVISRTERTPGIFRRNSICYHLFYDIFDTIVCVYVDILGGILCTWMHSHYIKLICILKSNASNLSRSDWNFYYGIFFCVSKLFYQFLYIDCHF